MKTKDFQVAIKAAGESDGLKAGQVRMLVSVFGNVDSYGDVVMPGAFAKSLADWAAKGDPIPFIWSHQWGDPFSHIGAVDSASEVEATATSPAGLEVVATLDVEGDDPENSKARKVYQLLKGRRVTQASFAYDTLDAEMVEREAEDGGKYYVYELRELAILEVGPTLLGANRDTELLEAKSREVLAAAAKAGRVLSTKNYAALQEAHAAIGDVLASAEAEKSGDAAVGVEKADGAGESEATDAGSAQARARLTLIGQ
ncbi:HK97 family phage prohead protease [Rhodococcoides fascians]|uniref:HK97 family phage prohead protease n=1 Tax=Rhodococcoides fascians TaxID=1828 RepID=UPI00068ED01F|nr:HK97 family phage prohead protease [Rhodococcus fascians]